MKKRRVTLNLDEDVVSALEDVGGKSLSDTANRALREAALVLAHHRALTEWLDELDEVEGAPSPDHMAAADRLLDEVFGQSGSSSAA
jgi:hypothetical protein